MRLRSTRDCLASRMYSCMAERSSAVSRSASSGFSACIARSHSRLISSSKNRGIKVYRTPMESYDSTLRAAEPVVPVCSLCRWSISGGLRWRTTSSVGLSSRSGPPLPRHGNWSKERLMRTSVHARPCAQKIYLLWNCLNLGIEEVISVRTKSPGALMQVATLAWNEGLLLRLRNSLQLIAELTNGRLPGPAPVL